jgi:hypothetical protein
MYRAGVRMKTPKQVKRAWSFGIAVLLLMYTLACGQTKQSSSETPSSATQRERAEQSPIAITKVAEGELTKVDPITKTLSIKTSQGQEMGFRYNDQTQIGDAEGRVEGLATQSGTTVRVHFDLLTRMATKIEIKARQRH